MPKFQPQFLPETKNTRLYMNLKNKVATEIDNEAAVEYSDNESGFFINYDTISKVPHFGNVAAGIPITVNPEFNSFLSFQKIGLFLKPMHSPLQ